MSRSNPKTNSKPSLHSCKSDVKRRHRAGKKVTSEVKVDDPSLPNLAGGRLEDMPVDVLERVFREYGSFKNLEQVGEFGEKFGKASGKLLHAAYTQFERELLHDIADTRKLFDNALSAEEINKDQSVTKKTTLCKSILQLETLFSTFAHVKATISSYASADICTHYDGELLDHFERARSSIMAAANRDPATKAAKDRIIGKCRAAAATYIWNYLLEVEEKTLTDDEHKGMDVFGGITLLNTLLCAKDACVSPPILTRYIGADSDKHKLVTIAVDLSLPDCWMGFFGSNDYAKQPAELMTAEALHVLRQLVWVSNSEYHLREWQETLQRSDMRQPKVPKSMSVLLGKGWYRNDGKTGRSFDCIDADDERVFYFGLHSRAKYRTSATRPQNQSSEERIRLVDRVVTIPKVFKRAVLDVTIEITCDENLLAEEFCQRAVVAERTMPAGLTASFALQIASYEDASRTRRVCDFPRYETKRRQRAKRLVIGDHAWRMMQVGDCADKHRIYEAEGKKALELEPNLSTLHS